MHSNNTRENLAHVLYAFDRAIRYLRLAYSDEENEKLHRDAFREAAGLHIRSLREFFSERVLPSGRKRGTKPTDLRASDFGHAPVPASRFKALDETMAHLTSLRGAEKSLSVEKLVQAMECIEEASLRFLQQYAPQQGEEFATTMAQLKRDVAAKAVYIDDTSDRTDGLVMTL